MFLSFSIPAGGDLLPALSVLLESNEDDKKVRASARLPKRDLSNHCPE
jgi:hypothetical protein